ncbi:type I phosphomannose isomerase catalytic subunit [uncultured Oscillibacter sp.]|uniref:type I phosphomannose isomerase catalytic subunit n=1 Tax=uncultured Oscillibacter sp. TaxID=876091 RepID=UPI0025E923AB|nr:type I phosphomannose isomerase catalytic subunit [uncultured Oscillibacter sp.]
MNDTPLKMHPCYKEYLWGGTRLKQEFSKADAPEVTAESWELAAHPDGCSTVAEGPLAGKTLAELGALDRRGVWGAACGADEKFPLLVKLIDAKRDLSIQVHPSGATALAELGEEGKAEMWYIVDCAPQSFLYFGFSRRVSPAEFLRRAKDGSICEVLNRVAVSPGDVFYILPGTIHAIGAGIVIAEIQQNSNTTFRIYDYDRRGTDGKPRPLHLGRAAEVLSYEPIVPEECRANSTVVFPEFTMAEMFSCRYFRAYRIDVRRSVELRCDGQSFHHILCVEGAGVVCAGETCRPIRRGESFLMPAAMGVYKIQGACRVLLSRV